MSDVCLSVVKSELQKLSIIHNSLKKNIKGGGRGRKDWGKKEVLESTSLSDIPGAHPSMRDDEDTASFPATLAGST